MKNVFVFIMHTMPAFNRISAIMNSKSTLLYNVCFKDAMHMNDYTFIIMYLKIDLSMDGLDVSESSRVMTFRVESVL